MKKRMKRILALVLSATMLFGVTACGSDKGKVKGRTKITFWATVNVNTQDTYLKVVDDFNASQSEITVQFVPQTSGFASSLSTSLRGSNTPDVVVVPSQSYKTFVDEGLLECLDEYAENDENENFSLEDFFTDCLNVYSYNPDTGYTNTGKDFYAIPAGCGSNTIVYNVDMFEEQARFVLDGNGYTIMKDVDKWDGTSDGTNIYHKVFTNGIDNSDRTVWAQSKSSAIGTMLGTKGKGTVNRVEWAVSDNTLYCKVDGQISCIIPLSDVYSEWAAGTKYKIALAGWNIEYMGMTSISDLEVLYGNNAAAKFPNKTELCSALTGDNKGMVYDALDDAYIPIYKEGSTAFYGAAGKNVKLTAEMQLLDKATTTGIGAGISVRRQGTNESAEFLAVYENNGDTGLRILNDLYWNWVYKDESGKKPEKPKQLDHTKSSPFTNDMVNGICNMTAELNGDTGELNIYFNRTDVASFTIKLKDYLPNYNPGAAVEIGIATNNSDEGITFFRNVEYTSDLAKELNGKNVSILGDGISTFTGVSNDASRNTTIENNAVEYTGTNCDVTNMYQTYWGQMLKKYNMNLLVNNSAGGNRLLDESGVVLVPAGYVRVEQLMTNTGYLDGEQPDIILVHMGTNDYIASKELGDLNTNTIGTAVKVAGGYKEPTTFTEAYVIALEKIKEQYPNAEVFCFTLSPSKQNSADKDRGFTLLEEYNARIRAIVEMYSAKNVTLVDTGIDKKNYTDYIYDDTHPNLKGMTLMAGKLERVMFQKYFPAQSQAN